MALDNHATDLQDQLSGHTHTFYHFFRLLWRKKSNAVRAVRAVRNSLAGRIRGQPILPKIRSCSLRMQACRVAAPSSEIDVCHRSEEPLNHYSVQHFGRLRN